MAERLPRAEFLPPAGTESTRPARSSSKTEPDLGRPAEVLCLEMTNGDQEYLPYCYLRRVSLSRSRGELRLQFAGCDVLIGGVRLDRLAPLLARHRVELLTENPRPLDDTGPSVTRIQVLDGPED